jgi:hypothetical protein
MGGYAHGINRRVPPMARPGVGEPSWATWGSTGGPVISMLSTIAEVGEARAVRSRGDATLR